MGAVGQEALLIDFFTFKGATDKAKDKENKLEETDSKISIILFL